MTSATCRAMVPQRDTKPCKAAGCMQKPTTLITGAGVRIGAILARHLAEAGHNLVLHYHSSGAAAAALGKELTEACGTRITLLQADLETLDDAQGFWRDLPPVTTIIHNASHYARDTIATFSPGLLRKHMAVNLEAPLILTQGFLAQLPSGAQGNVIVLGDGAHGWSISPEFFTYAASKFIWASLIDLLAAACAPRARANLIALGPTLMGEPDTVALFERLAARAPLKRNGTPHEICTAVDFLLASSVMTGQTLSLAAGFGLVTERPVEP